MKNITLRGSNMDCIHNLLHDGHIRFLPVNGQLYGSLVDLMAVFGPEGNTPRIYWNQQKKRLLAKDSELYQSLIQLKLPSADGKEYMTDVAPLWACVFIVLLMDTPKATEFKKRIAKFNSAEIKYRLLNLANGQEWAADSIRQDLIARGASGFREDQD